jgi:Brp/Blh family beta-carotene 15,15'-monooxygenase
MALMTHNPILASLFLIGLVLTMAVSTTASDTALLWFLALTVALLGLPHGSFDTAVAQRLFKLRTPLQTGLFMLVYVSTAAAVIALWWWQPFWALASFLLYSAWHFGDDVRARLGHSGAFGYGLWLLSLPLVWQPQTVFEIFQALGVANPTLILLAAPYTLALGGLMLLLAVVKSPDRIRSDWRDPLLLLVVATVLHPLAYFVAYFCFLHSPRHWQRVSARLNLTSWRDHWRAAGPTTLATYAIVAAAIPLLWHLSVTAMTLQLVFITLAALTVPHMVLEMMADQQTTDTTTGR